jgi:uncharacterized protein GlcG (DUF336 family)
MAGYQSPSKTFASLRMRTVDDIERMQQMTRTIARSIRTRAVSICGIAAIVVAGAPGALAQSSAPITYPKQTLTLEAANAGVAASIVKSRELGVLSVVAVYDEGGVLKALATMDGARFTGVQYAQDKAWTAARRQAATQDLADGFAAMPETLWHSFLKQPQTTLLGGGMPIVVNGQVVGGIGSSGGTIPQDIEVAAAGLSAIQH